MIPETTLTKAQRLPVVILHTDRTVITADVTGDHDTYRVSVARGSVKWVSCTCPAQVEACSHVLAVALKVKEQR